MNKSANIKARDAYLTAAGVVGIVFIVGIVVFTIVFIAMSVA